MGLLAGLEQTFRLGQIVGEGRLVPVRPRGDLSLELPGLRARAQRVGNRLARVTGALRRDCEIRFIVFFTVDFQEYEGFAVTVFFLV